MKNKFNNIQKELFVLIIFLLGILLGVGIIFGIDWYYRIPASQESNEPKTEEAENEFILSKDVFTTLVYWDQDSGFESLKNNKDKINYLSPFWYKVQTDGSIKKFDGAENETLLAFARDNNIKIIPTITNDCEPGAPEAMLRSSDYTNKNISELLDIVEKNNYDGINITYECLEDTSLRQPYSNFLSTLSEKLHEKDKLLMSAVHAKSSDKGVWSGTEIQDWKSIGQSCDMVKIMTYDYSWSTSEAGDIAPLSWMKNTLDYAVKIISPEKIYLGVHFYGYDWVDKKAEDLTYTDVASLLDKANPQVKTSLEGEKYFTYKEDNVSHTVYYSDSVVVKDRVILANQYDIAGIAIWRLGQEDSKNWQVIEEVLSK